jgi:hypothetical protein
VQLVRTASTHLWLELGNVPLSDEGVESLWQTEYLLE